MPLFDFGKIAESYDDYYKTEFGKQVDLLEKNLVRHLLTHVPRKKTLEIGCGTGHWTIFFRHLGFDILGVDISQQMLRVAKRKFPTLNCQFADATSLPFENASFDNVFTITTFEFIEDQQRAFDEAYRVLKIGGYFLIGALNLNSELGKTKDQSETFRNAKFFTPEQLQKNLLRFGSPTIKGCVVLENGQIVDYYKQLPDNVRLEKGAFLVGIVRKSFK